MVVPFEVNFLSDHSVIFQMTYFLFQLSFEYFLNLKGWFYSQMTYFLFQLSFEYFMIDFVL
jgi:hypothetical protein